jgi:hypothetical protein
MVVTRAIWAPRRIRTPQAAGAAHHGQRWLTATCGEQDRTDRRIDGS